MEESRMEDGKAIIVIRAGAIDSVLLHAEAALASVPIAGGALGTYFGEVRSRRAEERLKAYIDTVADELRQIDSSKLDKEYLRSEEFAETFARGAEEAVRAATKERVARFANVIVNNALATKEARERTTGLLGLVDRLSELDAFLLLSFGPPHEPSLHASSRAEAVSLVRRLAEYLGISLPADEAIVNALFYMDNLGMTWVTQRGGQAGPPEALLEAVEFSVYRSPLGDALAGAIAPPGFFLTAGSYPPDAAWPGEKVSRAVTRQAAP